MPFSVNLDPQQRAALGQAARRVGKTPHALARALIADGVRRICAGEVPDESGADNRLQAIATHVGMLEGWLMDELEDMDPVDAELSASMLATVLDIAAAWGLRDVLAACEKLRATVAPDACDRQP